MFNKVGDVRRAKHFWRIRVTVTNDSGTRGNHFNSSSRGSLSNGKGKGKIFPFHAVKTYKGNRSTRF